MKQVKVTAAAGYQFISGILFIPNGADQLVSFWKPGA
jgi:hypothetical protein